MMTQQHLAAPKQGGGRRNKYSNLSSPLWALHPTREWRAREPGDTGGEVSLPLEQGREGRTGGGKAVQYRVVRGKTSKMAIRLHERIKESKWVVERRFIRI